MEKEEIQAMTRRVKAKAVARALVRLKIPFKLDDDGFPIVLRRAAEKPFEQAVGERKGLNLSALENLRVKTEKRRQRAA